MSEKFKLKKNESYIFATDLDGTFLTSFVHSLHIDSYEAIKKIKENGHHFVITTGRSWWWTKTIYEQLKLVDASIHFSGAMIHHPKDEEFVEFRSSIPLSVLKNLFSKIDIWRFANFTQAVGRKYHATFSKDDDLNKLFFNCYEFIIEFNSKDYSINEFIDEIKKIIGNDYIFRIWNLFGDLSKESIIISPKESSKSEGLKKISKYYNIKRENIIYFGDNVNDLDALIWSEYSYVPSNALEIAKKNANEVLKLSCDEGAVPKKIIELIDEQNENN